MRYVLFAILALPCFVGSCDTPSGSPVCEVFFLHNQFLAEVGPDALHPEYGRVEYDEVLAALRAAGLRVHSERRRPGADLEACADRVAMQIRARLAAGVPAANLTVVGTSQGGYIAMLVSRRLKNRDVRFVLVGACSTEPWAAEQGGGLTGRILTIDEASDALTQECQPRRTPSADSRSAEGSALLLHTGLQHAFLYKALDEWLVPALGWARGAGAPGPRPHAPGSTATLAALVDAALDRAQDPPFNGVVLVAREHRTVLARCRGWADAKRSRPLVLRSGFGVGSISKQVTAVLALQLVQQGRLRLLDRLGEHVPDLAGTPAGGVRLSELLSHTHGLGGRDGPVRFPPGTSFAYSNVGFDLAGELLERVAGRSLQDSAEEEFRRIGMSDSRGPASPVGTHEALGMLAHDDGRWQDAAGPDAPRPRAASGGLVMSAPDLVTWTLALHGGALLRPGSLAAMLERRGVLEHAAFGRREYGLGITTATGAAGTWVGHTGMTSGTAAACFHAPDRGVTVVVLRNLLPASDVIRSAYAPHLEIVNLVDAALAATP